MDHNIANLTSVKTCVSDLYTRPIYRQLHSATMSMMQHVCAVVLSHHGP